MPASGTTGNASLSNRSGMKIGYEAKRLFTNYTGLGNYSRFVISALSVHKPDHRYLLFTPKTASNKDVDPVIARDNVTIVSPQGVYKGFTRLWRSWGISRGKDVHGLDIFHGLSQELPLGLPQHVKKVVTVHDLIFLRFPKFYHAWDVAIYKAKVRSACDRADVILAISDQTARDVVEFLHVDPSRIRVVYQGCHPNFVGQRTQTEMQAVRTKYNLPEEFILNVGTIEERKNIGLVVDALSLLPESLRIPVVLVGRPSRYMEAIVHRARQHRVEHYLRFLHNVSFEDLPAIYQQARVFVYPSLFEGFGIPLVEAIQSRIPVITSKGSCFSEAAGPDSLYAEPTAPDELARQLEVCLTDEDLRKRMVLKSLEYIQKFQPARIADELDRVYQELVPQQ